MEWYPTLVPIWITYLTCHRTLGFGPNLYQKSFFECFALVGITIIYFESLLHVLKTWFWLYMRQLPSIWSDRRTKLMCSKVGKFWEQCNPFFCTLSVILINLVSTSVGQNCQMAFILKLWTSIHTQLIGMNNP